MGDQVKKAVEVLRAGGLLALPTETVYGLGADASNEVAVRRIFAAKRRPATHPLIVHVASLEAARPWARDFPPRAEALATAFWPGPLTLIVTRSALAADTVTGGQDTVGLRVPNHPLALQVLAAFGGGIAAPSANRYGHVSPTTAAHVQAELGEDVDLVLDGGPCTVGVESTIIDVSGPRPRLLRPGGIPKEDVERVLGQPLEVVAVADEVRAPGQVASHYAPRAALRLTDEAGVADEVEAARRDGLSVAVLAPEGLAVPADALHLPVPADTAGFARALYASLREADVRGVQLVVAVPPPASGLGLAVRDRLQRASTPRPPG